MTPDRITLSVEPSRFIAKTMGIATGDKLTLDLPLKAVMELAADRVFFLAEDAAMDAIVGSGRKAFDILWERLDALSKD